MSILQGIRSSYSLFGPKGLLLVSKARVFQRPIEVSVSVPGIKYPVHLRLRTSDVSLFAEVLLKAEYDWGLPVHPRVIVDAGANIGLASVFFANKYPEARIISIEPEGSNFKVLQKNMAPYPNVACVQAALWNTDRSVTIADPGLGQWGFLTMEHSKPGKNARQREVEGTTVSTLMTRFGINYIDFFKVDIEGAEKEVFANPSMWIDRVGVIAIELHERLKIGCSRSVYLATKDFEWEFRRGETIFMGKGECSVTSAPEPGAFPASPSAASNRVSPRPPCQIVAVH